MKKKLPFGGSFFGLFKHGYPTFYGNSGGIRGGRSMGGMRGGSVGAGSTGGSVGAGSIGALVGGTEVEPGFVAGGIDVGSFGSDSLVRWTGDSIGVGVLVGVRVAVGVGVGMVDVIVGISEAVAVGTVEVGNGPKSAPAVMAMAVFVLFALSCTSALPRIGFLKTVA